MTQICQDCIRFEVGGSSWSRHTDIPFTDNPDIIRAKRDEFAEQHPGMKVSITHRKVCAEEVTLTDAA